MAWRRRALRWLLYAAGVCVTVLVTIVLVFALQARARLADLKPWHQVSLAAEFRAGADAPKTFPEYRALEDRLFAELRRKVLDDPAAADSQLLGRYTPGSIPARLALETPYNRSFELVPAEIRGAALLVHGLSDSPYSMRALADTLYAQGYYVLALRLPGHGTVPAGLADVSWRDWYAAVELAARLRGEPSARQAVHRGRPLDGRRARHAVLRARARRSESAQAARALSRLGRDRDLAVRRAHERARGSRVHPGVREVAVARRAARVRPVQVQLLSGQRGEPDLHGHSQAARRARRRAGARPARSDAARRHVPVGRRLDRDGGRGRARAAQLSAAARPRARRVRREPLRAARGARRARAARIARAAARGA